MRGTVRPIDERTERRVGAPTKRCCEAGSRLYQEGQPQALLVLLLPGYHKGVATSTREQPKARDREEDRLTCLDLPLRSRDSNVYTQDVRRPNEGVVRRVCV